MEIGTTVVAELMAAIVVVDGRTTEDEDPVIAGGLTVESVSVLDF